VDAAVADPRSDAVLAGARGRSLRLGHALAASLLAAHAAWSGDEADATLATLWAQRHVGGSDIAGEAHRRFDALSA
jgi:hypothetical protein